MAPPVPPGRAPIETKVQAAGVTAALAGAIVWILQEYVFKGTVSPGLVSLVYAAVPGALALAAGYLAPHTPRPAPASPAGVPPTGTVTISPVNPMPPPTGGQI